MNYTKLPIPCDLTTASLDWAMGQLTVPIYLHVHPSRMDAAREMLVDVPESSRIAYRVVPEVVPDDSLNINEWYLITTIGSDPAH